MRINQARANTKATPEAVFAACSVLAITNRNFRNEDVLSITGGGMSVVSRLVRIYRKNQDVIDACNELDASTAISLVQATNALLADHKAKSKTALDAAMETYLTTITELSDENERLTEELKYARDQAAKEMETSKNLRSDYEKTLRLLDARNQELEFAKANVQKLLSAQTTLVEKHELKIDALNARHTDKLAVALESQRKIFEKEKELAVINAKKINKATRKEDEIKIGNLEAELENSGRKHSELSKQHEVIKAERATLQERLNDVQINLGNSLNEKREQLKEAQRLYSQLIATFKSQQDIQAEYIADNLSAANKSANTLRPLLDELTEKLDLLLVKGNKQ